MLPNGDPILDALARLERAVPDLQRESKVRARCRIAMKKRAAVHTETGLVSFAASIANFSGVAALLLYLVAMFAEALHLASFF